MYVAVLLEAGLPFLCLKTTSCSRNKEKEQKQVVLKLLFCFKMKSFLLQQPSYQQLNPTSTTKVQYEHTVLQREMQENAYRKEQIFQTDDTSLFCSKKIHKQAQITSLYNLNHKII